VLGSGGALPVLLAQPFQLLSLRLELLDNVLVGGQCDVEFRAFGLAFARLHRAVFQHALAQELEAERKHKDCDHAEGDSDRDPHHHWISECVHRKIPQYHCIKGSPMKIAAMAMLPRNTPNGIWNLW